MQGENYHSATLTNKQVIEIRNGYNKGDNMEMIAKKYNVLGDTIRSVIKRKTFKNI
jgi:Mor family transcriptional regulator